MGKINREDEPFNKSLETVMERACNNLAQGAYVDLDNKLVNWPLLYNEVRQFIEREQARAVLETKLEAINKIFELSPKDPFVNWKPVDALHFYERLKRYEEGLQAELDKL